MLEYSKFALNVAFFVRHEYFLPPKSGSLYKVSREPVHIYIVRTDDIAAFMALQDNKGIPYSDYGTALAQGWHQVFFHDPEGNVIEVHQSVG